MNIVKQEAYNEGYENGVNEAVTLVASRIEKMMETYMPHLRNVMDPEILDNLTDDLVMAVYGTPEQSENDEISIEEAFLSVDEPDRDPIVQSIIDKLNKKK